MKFKTIKAYYGSVTMYRVVKVQDNEMQDVHIYNDEEVARTITGVLNVSVGGVWGVSDD
jgi:hypothetical protein